MNTKILLVGILAVLLFSSVALAAPITVYQGDTLTMPQVISTKTLDEDPVDGHLLYLYGTYQIEDDKQLLTQIHTNGYPIPIVNHQFNNLGTHKYTAIIMFAELQFNYTIQDWKTINSGIDISVEQEYNVVQITSPSPSFLQQLLNALLTILCTLFPQFSFCV